MRFRQTWIAFFNLFLWELHGLFFSSISWCGNDVVFLSYMSKKQRLQRVPFSHFPSFSHVCRSKSGLFQPITAWRAAFAVVLNMFLHTLMWRHCQQRVNINIRTPAAHHQQRANINIRKSTAHHLQRVNRNIRKSTKKHQTCVNINIGNSRTYHQENVQVQKKEWRA